jgi:hypothetical protein
MLREANDLFGQPVDARDGRLGTIEDLYFDDQDWCVRHAVVRAGVPFRRELLAIEPSLIARPEWPAPRLAVQLSRREARSRIAPSDRVPAAGAQPAHRLGRERRPGTGEHVDADLVERARGAVNLGHLRSLRDAREYRLSARDGTAGRVRDFIIDDRAWAICYVEVEVELFLGTKTVLVPAHAVEEVDAAGRAVRVGLSRRALGGAPRFQRLALQSRLYQMCVYDHYATAADGAPLMRPPRGGRGRGKRPLHPGTVDARMLLSTITD